MQNLKVSTLRVALALVLSVGFLGQADAAFRDPPVAGAIDFPTTDNSQIMSRYGYDYGKKGDVETEIDPVLRARLAAAETASEQKSSIANEIAAVKREYPGIYPIFNDYMLAFLFEPLSSKVAADVGRGAETKDDIARHIAAWSADNLVHTFHVKAFQDQTGKDPWGVGANGAPIFKKVIAGEMLAKSMYSGKITGKCEALPSFIAALFVLNGAAPDDVVILRLHSHNIGLLRFGGKFYLVNNQAVKPLDADQRRYLESNEYDGYFSYAVSVYREFPGGARKFKIDEAFYAETGSVLDMFRSYTGTKAKPITEMVSNSAPATPKIFADNIFSDVGDTAHRYNAAVTRYVYQSLYVAHPEIYLAVSRDTPKTAQLARLLDTPDDIFRWIEQNVAYGSIFENGRTRIMTADEVIVFKRGTLKDRAMLACALLLHRGNSCRILLTQKDAFVKTGDGIYAASNGHKVDVIPSEVVLDIGP